VEEQGSVQQIPGYQILSKLGAGAMAAVYKARQISLDRTVAIKILPKRMSENKEFVDRFYKEGKAAAKLNHAHIVGAVDVGEANGYHYFVMEYVEGQTVFDKLERGDRYSEKEALSIVIQVCRALAHAHKAGFIHRDVKPKNIMMTKDGVAKLADMGLARETSDVEAAQAEAGKAYGTPYYISPEQIRGELDVDARADLYSLGATFYHMVTGRVPFDASTPSAVMHKHLKEELVPPDHLNPDLTAGVGEIIEVAMSKRRRNRYQSADLERVAAGEPPLVARQHYDLSSLDKIGEGGVSSASRIQKKTNAVPVSAQETVDVDPRSLKERLMDPIVLGLGGIVLLLCFILVALVLAR
jgi:serine/threonine-protein kinase